VTVFPERLATRSYIPSVISPKGQQAVLTAMLRPEDVKGKRSLETKHFSAARLCQVHAVLKHSREMAEAVVHVENKTALMREEGRLYVKLELSLHRMRNSLLIGQSVNTK
jgi:hypothetical protein